MPYVCDNGDGNAAVLMLSDLETGNSIVMCPVCISPLMTQFVIATGVELELPGQITKDDLVTVATKREMDIDTMTKASERVRTERKAELALVMGELAAMVLPRVADSDPDDDVEGDEDGAAYVGDHEAGAVESAPADVAG